MSLKAIDTGFLRNLITYDASGNISLPAGLSIFVNKEVATKEYVDAQNSGQVLQSRTLTINGVTYDLSANRSWTIDSMVYPSAGIALSSGAGWETSIVNNSANWNTSFGWGNHAVVGYLTSFTETDPIWIADKPSYATRTYVNTSISNLVDSSPATLDTLNELAAALGDDPNFATTITTLIGTKEPAITAGTTSQYWRGDKSWQTLPIYNLPIASATVLGGIKVGTNLSINATTGVLDATFTYTLPTASTTVLGGVKVDGTTITINGSGVISVANTYVLPTATASILGGVKIGAGVIITSGVISVSTNYEPPITAGTTAQYWRGDKSWQTLPTYLLPIASTTVLGGIKVGANLSIDGSGILSSTDTNTTYSVFTRTVAGLVPNPGAATTTRYLREDGTWQVPPDTDTIVTSLAWTSITGRPTALSQFTNDIGNYGNWLVRSGDSMSGRLTIDSRASTNLPLHVLSVEPYVQIEAVGASNSAGLRMYPSGGFGAYVGNYATGELVLVAANSEAAIINSNSIRVNKYRFNGNGTLSGNGTPEIVDLASAGMAMQSLNYEWYNSNASALLMRLNSSGHLTANAFFEGSDIRYKNVIETNPDISGIGIDVIKFTRHGSDMVRYGYSAQQVQAIIPEAVHGEDTLTVNYMDVHTLKIASLERRVKELEERLKSTL